MSRSVTAPLHESLHSVTELDVTVLGVYSFSASILCSLSAIAQDTHHVMAEKDMPPGLYSTKAAASSPLLTFKPCCYRLLVEQLPPYLSWTSSLLSMVMNRRGS